MSTDERVINEVERLIGEVERLNGEVAALKKELAAIDRPASSLKSAEAKAVVGELHELEKKMAGAIRKVAAKVKADGEKIEQIAAAIQHQDEMFNKALQTVGSVNDQIMDYFVNRLSSVAENIVKSALEKNLKEVETKAVEIEDVKDEIRTRMRKVEKRIERIETPEDSGFLSELLGNILFIVTVAGAVGGLASLFYIFNKEGFDLFARVNL